MKIEKISDRQIRCTLNREDLANRHLRISELAYGSDNARALFRDMMQQASSELGFDADNFPLMIEAIPVSPDCLILVITKVEDPDDLLDTRFSNFTPAHEEDEDGDDFDMAEENENYADEILHCFEQINNFIKKQRALAEEKGLSGAEARAMELVGGLDPAEEAAKHLARSFRFGTLEEASVLAGIIAPFYNGCNTLYKNKLDSSYHLVLEISSQKPADFNKVCNIISEYGTQERFSASSAAYYEEHMECIIRDRAVQVLAKL